MGRILTLLYHRVNTLDNDINLLAVSQEHFREQMEWLKNNYPIVRFEEDWDILEEDSVCITFDDGYMDNFMNALPILQELQIPAAIFVSTGTMNTNQEFWWDDLERNIYAGSINRKPVFGLEDEIFSCMWATDTCERQEELYKTLHWLMYNKISVSKRENWMRQLYKWNGWDENGREENKPCQVEECLSEDISLITIGAHTVHHPSLAYLEVAEQEYEIIESKNTLENQFKRPVTIFSYPFGGKSDFNDETIKICKKAGFIKAAANYPGVWTNCCDPYQIPRNIVRNWEINEFKDNINLFWRKRI